MYTVTITLLGLGRYRGGCYVRSMEFNDEKAARDYYAEKLVRYPDKEVKLEKR